MGHLRVVALDSTILYVQPLFLSAEENPIPEVWRVVVSDGRDVVMRRTLDGAMAALDLTEGGEEGGTESAVTTGAALGEQAGWPREALDLLDRARERLGEGDWAGDGRLMEELRSLLERWNRVSIERQQ